MRRVTSCLAEPFWVLSPSRKVRRPAIERALSFHGWRCPRRAHFVLRAAVLFQRSPHRYGMSGIERVWCRFVVRVHPGRHSRLFVRGSFLAVQCGWGASLRRKRLLPFFPFKMTRRAFFGNRLPGSIEVDFQIFSEVLEDLGVVESISLSLPGFNGSQQGRLDVGHDSFGIKLWRSPSPSQAGHAPAGLLKEKRRGAISGSERPQSAHALVLDNNQSSSSTGGPGEAWRGFGLNWTTTSPSARSRGRVDRGQEALLHTVF